MLQPIRIKRLFKKNRIADICGLAVSGNCQKSGNLSYSHGFSIIDWVAAARVFLVCPLPKALGELIPTAVVDKV